MVGVAWEEPDYLRELFIDARQSELSLKVTRTYYLIWLVTVGLTF